MTADRRTDARRTQTDELPAPPDLWSLYIMVDRDEVSERTRAWKRAIDLLSVEFADALSQEPSALVVEQVIAICLTPVFNGWRPGSTADVLRRIASLLEQYRPLVGALFSQPDSGGK